MGRSYEKSVLTGWLLAATLSISMPIYAQEAESIMPESAVETEMRESVVETEMESEIPETLGGNATRAEIAAILKRFVEKYESVTY